MCQKFTVEILKTGPQVCPGGDGRGSWEVNLETKDICWNQTLTSTNIRSETMNLMNKRWSGECTGREAGGSKLCSRHPLWKCRRRMQTIKPESNFII